MTTPDDRLNAIRKAACEAPRRTKLQRESAVQASALANLVVALKAAGVPSGYPNHNTAPKEEPDDDIHANCSDINDCFGENCDDGSCAVCRGFECYSCGKES